MKKIIIPTILLLSLSACGIYKPYKSAESVREGLYGEVQTSDSLNIADLSWQEFFADTLLHRLIEKGLSSNADLLIAQSRIREAEASLLGAKLSYLPGVSLMPQGTMSGLVGESFSQSYTLPVSASWQIDLFGSQLNANRQSAASLAQTQALAQGVRSRLIAGIANSYYTLLMLDRQLDISMQTRDRWAESVRAAKALKEAGSYTEAAVAQTEATYYDICNSVEELRFKVHQTEIALSLYLHEPVRPILRGTIEEQQFDPQLAIGLPVQLLRNRPDVMAAEQALARAFYGVASARSAFYPSLTLSGSIGFTNQIGQTIVDPGRWIAGVVGSLTQPIFNRGQNIARLKISKEQQTQATLTFENTLLRAGGEVNESIAKLHMAQLKGEGIDQQIASLERAATSTRLLMQNGSTNYLEVLTAERTLLSARLVRVANQFAQIQSRINLYQALGGGR